MSLEQTTGGAEQPTQGITVLNHRHLTDGEMRKYNKLLNYLSHTGKSVEDLWFPRRLFARRVHRQVTQCSACRRDYDEFTYD